MDDDGRGEPSFSPISSKIPLKFLETPVTKGLCALPPVCRLGIVGGSVSPVIGAYLWPEKGLGMDGETPDEDGDGAFDCGGAYPFGGDGVAA